MYEVENRAHGGGKNANANAAGRGPANGKSHIHKDMSESKEDGRDAFRKLTFGANQGAHGCMNISCV